MEALAPPASVRRSPDAELHPLQAPVLPSKTLAAESRPLGPRGRRRRARTSVAAAPRPTSAAATHLSGFYVRAVEPRESSYLHYSSLASPGTHTEYHVSVADVVAGGARWVVSRRFSAFLLLRDELQRGLALSGPTPHCARCGALRDELAAVACELPRKRLWGSSRAAVVRRRAALFLAFLRALLALATNAERLHCPVVCFGFAVQVRTFLTRDCELVDEPAGEPAGDKLGGERVSSLRLPLADAVDAFSGTRRSDRGLLGLAIREGDAEDEDEEDAVALEDEARPTATRRGSYSRASTSASRRSSTEDTSASTASSSARSRAVE